MRKIRNGILAALAFIALIAVATGIGALAAMAEHAWGETVAMGIVFGAFAAVFGILAAFFTD